jgi:hypothetical protein
MPLRSFGRRVGRTTGGRLVAQPAHRVDLRRSVVTLSSAPMLNARTRSARATSRQSCSALDVGGVFLSSNCSTRSRYAGMLAAAYVGNGRTTSARMFSGSRARMASVASVIQESASGGRRWVRAGRDLGGAGDRCKRRNASEDGTQMSLVNDQDVIKELSARGANESLLSCPRDQFAVSVQASRRWRAPPSHCFPR